MNLVEHLDSLATHLESMGMMKQAHEVDVVSNTLEARTSDPETKAPGTSRFFSADELRKKGRQYADRLYQEYVDSARGKKAYDKALKAHAGYNTDKADADAATVMILEDVGGWLKAMDKSEGEVNLLKEMLKDKILAGIT
jgi:hypothetical protein